MEPTHTIAEWDSIHKREQTLREKELAKKAELERKKRIRKITKKEYLFRRKLQDIAAFLLASGMFTGLICAATFNIT